MRGGAYGDRDRDRGRDRYVAGHFPIHIMHFKHLGNKAYYCKNAAQVGAPAAASDQTRTDKMELQVYGDLRGFAQQSPPCHRHTLFTTTLCAAPPTAQPQPCFQPKLRVVPSLFALCSTAHRGSWSPDGSRSLSKHLGSLNGTIVASTSNSPVEVYPRSQQSNVQ